MINSESQDQKIKAYIDEQTRANVPLDVVRQNLIDAGWSDEFVAPYFAVPSKSATEPLAALSKKIGSIALVVFAALLAIGVVIYLLFRSESEIEITPSGTSSQEELELVESCEFEYSTFADAVELAETQIAAGPLDEYWQCSTYDDCQAKWNKQRDTSQYEAAVEVFIGKAKEMNGSFTPFINDTIHDDIFTGKYFKELEALDLMAKALLTPETYAVEKAGRFTNLIPFMMSFIELYPSIETALTEAEEYVLLTEEEQALLESEIQRTGLLPDPNDPRFSFLRNKPIGFDEDFNVIVPEKFPLNFPVVQINESRIAVNLGEWYLTAIYDLVNIDGCWKVDLIEPYRPSDTSNPRIKVFDMRISALELYWNQIQSQIALVSLDTELFVEFKGWWDAADKATKKEFILTMYPESNGSIDDVSDSMLLKYEYHFFFQTIPVESEGGLLYDPVEPRLESLFMVPFTVSKQDGTWNLESQGL